MATVRLFAALREIAGISTIEVDAPTVGALCEDLSQRFGPEFARILAVGSVVVEGRAAGADHELLVDDEVALLPPVSGGAGIFQPAGALVRS
ncbi:MAG TPA: MoaD/ThiS family protein [Actinomycetota bacterium]|nr:MoaD/ThiS family protein [Actinomycetota bacterium]